MKRHIFTILSSKRLEFIVVGGLTLVLLIGTTGLKQNIALALVKPPSLVQAVQCNQWWDDMVKDEVKLKDPLLKMPGGGSLAHGLAADLYEKHAEWKDKCANIYGDDPYDEPAGGLTNAPPIQNGAIAMMSSDNPPGCSTKNPIPPNCTLNPFPKSTLKNPASGASITTNGHINSTNALSTHDGAHGSKTKTGSNTALSTSPSTTTKNNSPSSGKGGGSGSSNNNNGGGKGGSGSGSSGSSPPKQS